jgi:hypothetical protein
MPLLHHRKPLPERSHDAGCVKPRPKRGLAAGPLALAVGGGIAAGILVTWIALKPGERPRLDTRLAEADAKPVINLTDYLGQSRRASARSRLTPNRHGGSQPSAPTDLAPASDEDKQDRPHPPSGTVAGSTPDHDAQTEAEIAGAESPTPAEADRRREAFQAFQSLPKSVSLPPAAAKTDVGIGASSAVTGDSTELDLGPFSVADLVNPQFHLAVPQDRINSRDFFKAEVAPVVGKDRVWAIRFLPQGENLDGQAQQPQELAALIERDGRLILKVPVSNELRRPPFALLRRSVILIEAKDPTNDGAPPTVQEIRLVEPTRVPPLVIDLFAEKRQELKIPMPPGIPRPVFTESGTIEQCKVPIASVRLEAKFPCDETKTVELSEDVQDGTDPGIKKWECPLEQPNPTLGIQAVVELSLPNATLAVTTEFTGPYADRVEKDDAKKYYIDEPGGTLRKGKTAFFNHVMPAKQFTLDDRDRGKIEKWFRKPLRNFPVMPGHETALDSFGLFLKERYEEAKKLKPNEEPKLPEDNKTFTTRCQKVRNEKEWEQVYAKPVSDWADWFWSKFEKQWEENCKQFQGAVAVQHEIRIRAITSLAYDENDREYEVPLVFGTN